MDLDVREAGDELEEGQTVMIIYYVRKISIFNRRKIIWIQRLEFGER